MAAIPVVDYFALTRCGDGSLEGKEALGELHRAFSTTGFVYVVNHEVEEQMVHVNSGHWIFLGHIYTWMKVFGRRNKEIKKLKNTVLYSFVNNYELPM